MNISGMILFGRSRIGEARSIMLECQPGQHKFQGAKKLVRLQFRGDLVQGDLRCAHGLPS